MRPLTDAKADVLAAVAHLPEVQLQVQDALGLVLSRDAVAPHDVPPFPNSAMDGYAVRAADVAAAPVTLRVVEDVPAGSVATRTVEEGTAIKIMTGAPLPDGADAVVKVEDTEPGEDDVKILVGAPAGTAVREAGGDVAAGATVFTSGTRLGAAHLAALASFGVARPWVRRRPVVAYMSTGDELVEADSPELGPGMIRDSNRVTLRAMLAELGVDGLDLGIITDDADALRDALARAAAGGDCIITSGGVSMGEYDLVKQVLSELGGVDFWQVAMQPGKPFAFGSIGGKPFFGLPGNPVSVIVAFEQFARPALLRMMGAATLERPRVRGVLAERVVTNPEKVVFLRVVARWDGDGFVVSLAGGQDSNVLSAMARANALAVVPVGTGTVEPGNSVELVMLGG